jgi:outer membrane receptor for ferrienterochelin and colicin
VSFTSEAWLDVSNTREVPARWLVGASAGWTPWFARSLTLTATVTNLFDVRIAQRLGTTPGVGRIYTPIQDFFGYPLPGRAFFVALTAQTDS